MGRGIACGLLVCGLAGLLDTPVAAQETAATQCVPAPITATQIEAVARQALADPTIRSIDDDAERAGALVSRIRAAFTIHWALRCSPDLTSSLRSSNSAANNPTSATLIESASFTEMISVALDRAGVSSDQTAVTVNVNALALAAAGKGSVYTSPAEFRAASALRRLGGSVTFGSELPKEEIVGFSGIPDADELFEAVTWDVRYRILGDRDVRAREWDSLLSQAALSNQLNAQIIAVLGSLAVTDPVVARLLPDILMALNGVAADTYDAVASELANSWVVTLKTFGQHMATGGEADRYGLSLLADKGDFVGPLDFVLNATVSRSFDDAEESTSEDTPRFDRLDNLDVAVSLGGAILRSAIVEGRSANLSLTGRALVPLGESTRMPVTITREWEWNVGATLELPLGDNASIPLSLVYTNDPNALEDQRYVEGRLGLSWDFGAIASALKKMAGAESR